MGSAAGDGHLGDVKQAVEDGQIHVDMNDDGGCTPLMRASAAGQVDIVQYLLGMNANIEPAVKEQRTVLHYSAPVGHVDVIKLPLDRCVNFESARNDQCTAFQQ